MRVFCRTLILAIVIAATVLTAHAQPGARAGRGDRACTGVLDQRLESLPVMPLSSDETAALSLLRLEEKLARDVYTTLSLQWDLPIFSRIARAEQRHMDLVGLLLARHELEDPVTDGAIGAFSEPGVATLYSELIEAGTTSLEDALRVGARVEDMDLADLDSLLKASPSADVALIAHNLAKGSRNHLRAFTGALDRQGATAYEPQYLNAAQLDAVLTAPRERGVVYDELGATMSCEGRQGRGRGNGRGVCRNGGQGAGAGKGACDGSGRRSGGRGGNRGNGQGTCTGDGPGATAGSSL
jgi:hypothetical protein